VGCRAGHETKMDAQQFSCNGLGADSSTASTGLSAAGAAGLGTSPPASEEITATSLQKGWRNWATYHSNMYQEDIIKYMYLYKFLYMYICLL